MFATSLIVFRETLEAALFVGVIAASTRGLAGRNRWLAGGVVAGGLGSLLLAAGMERVSNWADGVGQDLLNVAILSTALLMLAWHCIWVSTHAREMVRDARRLGSDAASGARTLWALSVAVSLAVLREGAETVLFVAGFLSGSDESFARLLSGAIAGLAGGCLTGALIYWGLARIQTAKLFAVTNVLILLLAGSLASQLAKVLIQSGLVTAGSAPLWDTSVWLPDEAPVGIALHALIGYDASPSILQIVFQVGTILGIWFATHQMKAWTQRRQGLAALA
jgi:high-affinity iron transporter